MVVIVLTAVPPGLRGHLTRWLLEITPGVYVGHATARVRDLMWERIVELVQDGRALMVHSVRGEQRLAFKVHGHDWRPVDFEGITLMRRRDQVVPEDFDAARYVDATADKAFSLHEVQRRRQRRRKFKTG